MQGFLRVLEERVTISQKRQESALQSKRGLAARCDTPKSDEEKIRGLDSQVVLDAKSIAHQVMLEKYHCTKCYRKIAKTGELRRSVIHGKETFAG